MKNKKMWKMSISLLMVLCLMWAAIGQCLPSGTAKAAEPTAPVEYTVELKDATNVFLCNKKAPTDNRVIIKYKVKSMNAMSQSCGMAIAPDYDKIIPYSENGSVTYYPTSNYFFEVGNEHVIEIIKQDDGSVEGWETVNKTGYERWKFPANSQPGDVNAQYYGMWIANMAGGTDLTTAELVNVTCEDGAGNDLGLQTNSDNCIITGGETSSVPTEYTVKLNDASNVFLCNKKAPAGNKVFIKYNVKSMKEKATSCGIAIAPNYDKTIPYSENGSVTYYPTSNYFFEEGNNHVIEIIKKDDGSVEGWETVDKTGYERWKFPANSQPGDPNAQYYGMWIANQVGEQGTDFTTAELINVTCVDEYDNDLGLQTNSPNCEIYANHGTLEGATVSLGDDIGVNFYMDLSNNILADENAYVEFTHPDQNNTVERVMVKDAVKGTYEDKEYSVFTCNIAAKEMASDIKLKVVNGSGIAGEEFTYQVKTYGDKILADTKNAYTANEKAMVKAMLNYGAYAQTHFGYNTEKLANAEMKEVDKTLAEVALDDTYKYSLTGSCTGLNYYGTSLMTTSKTAIRHYFKLTDGANIDEFTFRYSGNTLVPTQKGMLYYIEIPGIVASRLGEMYELTVTKGTETMTLTYSPYTNVKGILAGGTSYTENSKNMMRALYWYGCAAAALKN